VAVLSFNLAKAWNMRLTFLLLLLSFLRFLSMSPTCQPPFAFSNRKPTQLTVQIFHSITVEQLLEKQLKSLS